ncbi:MAG: cyclase family protein [Proteobacteria bacterium]|nr:cyclase family protein [Pseudomonadota bacterium]
MSDVPKPPAELPTPSSEELWQMFEALKNWGRWGPDDERGALNHLTPSHRSAAAALVRDGVALSLAHALPLLPSADTPIPALHHMLAAGDARDASGIPGYEASRDWIGMPVHGLGITHVDALCHIFVRGQMYNGVPASEVRSDGARRNTLKTLSDGVVGRGVLVDLPAARGAEFLEPGEPAGVAELEAAESAQGVSVGPGDVLLVSTGRDARRRALGGTLDPGADGLAGLHPECLPWLQERRIAVLGSDGISDPMPGLGVGEWPFPVHQIGIAAMGLHLIDNLDLGPLLRECASRGHWAFLFSLAPLRIEGGTGCPVNPLAVL